MIKRLQWLYPPTAHKFFLNLMGVTCDRLENLTECYAEIKMQYDSVGLCNRDMFLKVLDTEIQRSRSYSTKLSLCCMKLNFEDGDTNPDKLANERIMCELGESFSKEIRSWDTLSQFDGQTFALLMPQTSFDEAKNICHTLKRVLENKNLSINAIRVKIAFGLAELVQERDKTGSDLLAKATALLQNASYT